MNLRFFWTSDSCFSQWYPRDMVIDNIMYSSCEQYMMYQKALLFKDYDAARIIIKTKSPKRIKEIGRKVRNFNQQLWEQYRVGIVYTANYHKFKQHHDLRMELTKIPDAVFVEASPYDTIWGVGLREEDPRIMDPMKWKGQNLLGKIITDIKERLLLEA